MAYPKLEHIAAGQFKVSRADDCILQAYLATCLGVALYDSNAKVGGLIHILLPESPGTSNTSSPEKYASTGIPMLVRDMISLGAEPQNMTATIAGGALVGPVTNQDIFLDIGGRSADIAISMLEAGGIKTIKSETGGFFTCTLEMNLQTGDTRINPTWENLSEPATISAPPTLDDISDIIEQLKPIPQTALKILRMFKSRNKGIEEITGELAKDQVLSGKTLKICNSALFAGNKKIDSLKDAVLILGENMLIKSVIAAAVNTYLNQTGASGYSLCKGGLFFHAIGVATMAEKIAEKAGMADLKSAYTAGLLHDVGKVVLDQYICDRIPLFFRNIAMGQKNFIDTEKKILGITHSEAGALLARKWNFPQNLTDVILLHHAPEQAEKNQALIYTIYLANLILEKFHTGLELELTQTESFEKALDFLGLTMQDLPELIDAIPFNIANME